MSRPGAAFLGLCSSVPASHEAKLSPLRPTVRARGAHADSTNTLVQITRHSVASIEYTLSDDQGNVIDSSSGGPPLVYVHGLGALIPGLESHLEGKRKGDALEVRVEPKDGYGERDEQMVARVPLEQMPKGAPLELGMQLEARSPEGSQVVTVVKLEDDAVWLDANHPLAGVHLNFKVSVVDVRAATREELEHGHVHGPGGAHH